MSARILCALAAFAGLSPAPALAWGPAGHRWVAGVAAETLPAELPAFLKTPLAVAAAGEMANDPDRSRTSGRVHDHERDAGHFIDLTDDGKVMGVLPLSALPETRAEYDALLNAGGTDQYKAGYLPYAMIDGFQQLAKDFAYWRADVIGETSAATAEDRAWFAADRKLREALTLRDYAFFSHFVADATQPHHTSVHYDNWGDFPNPQNYRAPRGFHVRFENQFVQANVKRAEIAAALPAFSDCGCPLMQRLQSYIVASHARVEPLFGLEARGMFPMPPAAPPSNEGGAFARKQLILATAELRDLTVLAWRASEAQGVGYPTIPLADILSGKVKLTRAMFGGE
jgi:hypothetical protein